MQFSGFAVGTAPEVVRAGRKRSVDPEFLAAYAEGLAGLEGDALLVLADVFEDRKQAQRAVLLLKSSLVSSGHIAEVSMLRARIWAEGENYRAGLRVGPARERKAKTEAAPAAATSEPEPQSAEEPALAGAGVEASF